tara:strand:- start:450 stop:974 length:525 start_codon:yes stop_codon:yes gene_type:complete
MAKPRKIPINRINKFFSNEDYDLEISMGREAIEGDGNFVVILYRVDRENTSSDDLYGEASKDGVRFFPPVELRVVPTLEEAENKAYNSGSGGLRYIQDGNLSFGIYESQLAELDVELNFGDYIGYPVSVTDVRYFSVTNDGVKNYDNKHTIMGYKGAYRTVKCSSVDENEFRGL